MEHRKAVHICLISGHLIPNLIPLLEERPEIVQLVVTEGMKAQSLRFKKILEQNSFQVIEPDHECPDTGLSRILEKALELATQLDEKYPGYRIVLNATGGTKLMALGFVQVFRDISSAEIIYTDTEHSRIEFLGKPPKEPRAMTDVLTVPLYLATYGFTVRSCASDDRGWLAQAGRRKALSKWLAAQTSNLGDFLGALNRLAIGALDGTGETLKEATQRFNEAPRGKWRGAMQEIAKSNYGLVDWDGAATITFLEADAARYLGGIWLEEYTWHIVCDTKPHDVRCSLKGTWDGGEKAHKPENEFDLVATYRNCLLVVECKTLKFGRDESKDQDILYKLDALGNKARGLFGATWLISARILTDNARSRAKSQKIEVIEAHELPRLREKVLAWMG